MLPDRRTLSLAVLVAVAVTVSVLHSPSAVLSLVETTAANPLVFFGAIVALYTIRPLLLWPTTLVAVVVGYGYGIAVGIPVALVGAVFTSVVPFYTARLLGRDAPTIARLQSVGERFFGATGDLRGVVAGRLAPVPADAVTCAAALADVRFRHFAAGVLAGELPWTVAAVVVGASLSTLSADGIGAIGTPLAVVTALAAGLLVAGPLYSLSTAGEESGVAQ